MISVIIPCFNCDAFIERAINSTLNQTFDNFEIILVNNNSTDSTYQKLHVLKSKYPNLIKVFSESKKGAPAARNKGLSEASGDFVQFLDADDELMPLKLESQIRLAYETDADVIIGSRILRHDVSGKIKDHIKHPNQNTWEGLINSDLGITSSNLWRKASIENVGGWDSHLSSSQEYDLLFRLLKSNAKFAFDFNVQTIIYKGASTISKSINKGKTEEIITNRIKLRKSIITYLNNKQMLTKKLNNMANDYIYNELISHSESIPAFVNAYMTNNHLKISRSLLLQNQIKGFIKRIL